ncbi:hypothetical protein VUR80DRAFT_47 [Thermomyces stellatus]
MADSLPTIPRIVFTILEPISLVTGFIGAVANPDWFITEQVPSEEPYVPSINSRLVAMQLGNLYLLLCMVGLAVLSSTSEIKVVRNYLVALWIADISHIALTWHALGHDNFVDVTGWNAMTWGNVGATATLFFTRTAYFLGVFGPDRPALPSKKTR